MKKFIPFNDVAFKYTGVWQENDKKQIVSYHTSSQLELGFTGGEIDVSINFSLKDFVKFLLDGEEITPEITDEGVIISELSEGSHILKIIAQRHCKIYFKGIYLNGKEKTFATENNTYIQFIGDSITDAYPGFSTAVANELMVDYSIVSLCGISLVDKWGWYKLPEGAEYRHGMETTYFSLQNLQETLSPAEYDFKVSRVPDAFVVFLGTNDYISSVADKEKGNIEIFAEKYCAFLNKIRTHFGDKPIFILQAHRSNDTIRIEAINKAFELFEQAYSPVYLLDCNNWDVELLSDNVHPSDNGYKAMTSKIALFIKEKLEL